MDIDAERLRTAEIVTSRLIEAHGAGARVEATTDRRAALDGADYVVTSFQVGGYKPSTVVDFEVPKRYGLRQTIADTLGIGGIMRGLRTIPVLLDVCRDLEELSPDALLLNYVNPMAMLCWAVAEATLDPHRRALPLGPAHGRRAGRATSGSPPGRSTTSPPASTTWRSSCASSTTARTSTPRCASVEPPDSNRVRYEVLKHFGYFVTESSEHFAEYVPWFIKDGREDLIERFNMPLDEYPRRCERQIGEWEALRDELEERADAPTQSHEYGAHIIRACETGEPYTFNGNVPNRWEDGLLIDNLPADCCVEVPCVASAAGHRAAAGRRAAAPTRGADADQHQRPGPDGRGRADRPPRGDLPGGDARPAHRRRAVAGRDRALWWTISWKRTGSGFPRPAMSTTMSTGQPREDAKIAFDRERRRRALSRLASRHALRGRRRLAHAARSRRSSARSARRAAPRSASR